jgi:hypothetical protein
VLLNKIYYFCLHIYALLRGVTRRKVEQFPRRLRLVASKLMHEGLVGCARDERSDHIRIDDVGKLIALLEKAADVLT